QKTGRTAWLGEPGLKAGIGLQVPVNRPLEDSASTADIDKKEHEFINKRRSIWNPTDHPDHKDNAKAAEDPEIFDAIGLALSGGGIRSATVCLGAVQVLARHNLLAEIDYLSTVSGGGYFGSFVSSILVPFQDGKAP